MHIGSRPSACGVSYRLSSHLAGGGPREAHLHGSAGHGVNKGEHLATDRRHGVNTVPKQLYCETNTSGTYERHEKMSGLLDAAKNRANTDLK